MDAAWPHRRARIALILAVAVLLVAGPLWAQRAGAYPSQVSGNCDSQALPWGDGYEAIVHVGASWPVEADPLTNANTALTGAPVPFEPLVQAGAGETYGWTTVRASATFDPASGQVTISATGGSLVLVSAHAPYYVELRVPAFSCQASAL
jgi:hypothetical protein